MKPSPPGNPARASALPWLLFLAALTVAAWALWRAFGATADGDPVSTSLTAFERQNRLTVFSAQLSPVVASNDERLFGLVKSRQVAGFRDVTVAVRFDGEAPLR